MKNKNIWMIVLVILVIGLAGTLTYVLISNNSKEKSSNETTKNTINESTEDQKNNKEDDVTVYINYTSENMPFFKDDIEATLKLELVNKELKGTVDGKSVEVIGLDKNIKSFTYSSDGTDATHMYILVLNENNEVFVSSITGEGFESLEFEKINTNEKIKDITVTESSNIENYIGLPISVVLENNEIRSIIEDDDYNFLIGKINYSNK